MATTIIGRRSKRKYKELNPEKACGEIENVNTSCSMSTTTDAHHHGICSFILLFHRLVFRYKNPADETMIMQVKTKVESAWLLARLDSHDDVPITDPVSACQ
uniref:Uncharacterized protein n=1 Tax=Lotharella oceanica TaxID=641309 RepID=A0A7S2U408_9EUKA|mmetsp:Transcript_7139/g.14026  ORF Transcript_7139/g.14026 Transcript_7139/m.14026 type:complete len:102 (+) Transcript_7139:427-732(+)